MDYKKTELGFMLRLVQDEKIVASLQNFAEKEQLSSGFITAIGAVEKITLGIFDLKQKDYLRKDFADVYELASLQGNLATIEGEPFFHLHCVLADQNYRTIAGHLFEAVVAVTFEAQFITQSLKVERKFDSDTGLKLLDLS